MDTDTTCHFSRNRALDFLRPAARRVPGFGSVEVRRQKVQNGQIFRPVLIGPASMGGGRHKDNMRLFVDFIKKPPGTDSIAPGFRFKIP